MWSSGLGTLDVRLSECAAVGSNPVEGRTKI